MTYVTAYNCVSGTVYLSRNLHCIKQPVHCAPSCAKGAATSNAGTAQCELTVDRVCTKCCKKDENYNKNPFTTEPKRDKSATNTSCRYAMKIPNHHE
jgi:hypothetical protein